MEKEYQVETIVTQEDLMKRTIADMQYEIHTLQVKLKNTIEERDAYKLQLDQLCRLTY
jgi:hypothetical protein